MDTALPGPEPPVACAAEATDALGGCADPAVAVPEDQDQPAAHDDPVRVPDRGWREV
jgi:hypothetical protein